MPRSSIVGSCATHGTPQWKQSERICAARAVGAILNDLLPRLADQITRTG